MKLTHIRFGGYVGFLITGPLDAPPDLPEVTAVPELEKVLSRLTAQLQSDFRRLNARSTIFIRDMRDSTLQASMVGYLSEFCGAIAVYLHRREQYIVVKSGNLSNGGVARAGDTFHVGEVETIEPE